MKRAIHNTFASVLGVFKYRGIANNTMDANEIGSSGYWTILNENRPSNLPYVGNGMLISFVASIIKVQLVFDKNAAKGYWRMFYSTWTEWKEL